MPIPPILQWFGVAIALGSNALFIWVHRTLDRQWSLSLRMKTEHQLITSGPHRYVRHPMYTALGIYNLGMILISADILLLIFFTISLGYDIHRVDREELMLIEEFGDAYRNYMETTGRFLPRLRSPVNTSTTSHSEDTPPS